MLGNFKIINSFLLFFRLEFVGNLSCVERSCHVSTLEIYYLKFWLSLGFSDKDYKNKTIKSIFFIFYGNFYGSFSW